SKAPCSLLVGGPPQANLEASTERPSSNMRNQPNPGDAQGTCYTPPEAAVSARIDWRCQPGVVAPHADRGSCFWRKGRRDGRRALVPRSGKPGWRRRTTAATPGGPNGGGGADRAIFLRIWTLSSRRLP